MSSPRTTPTEDAEFLRVIARCAPTTTEAARLLEIAERLKEFSEERPRQTPTRSAGTFHTFDR